MLLIGGIIAIVVFTIQVYKTANGTERNAPLWALLTAGIGIAFQFVIPVFVGIVIGIYFIATGAPVETLQSGIEGISLILGVVCIVLSIVGMLLVSRHVARVIDIPVGSVAAPPPPPRF